MEKKLGVLLGLLGLYKQLCLDTNLPSRQAIEKKWIEMYKDLNVQNAVDDLLSFEVGCLRSMFLYLYWH